MTDTNELARQLVEAAEKATPGPWYVTESALRDTRRVSISGPGWGAFAEVWATLDDEPFQVGKDTADFIALANPENIKVLLAERDALRKQIASVELVMKEVRGWANDAGSTKTPRGRTLNAVLRRLREALKGKQAARALRGENKND